MRWPRIGPSRSAVPGERGDDNADDKDLAVGKRLSIETASGDKRTVVVAGIYDQPEIEQMLGAVTIGQEAFDRTVERPRRPPLRVT